MGGRARVWCRPKYPKKAANSRIGVTIEPAHLCVYFKHRDVVVLSLIPKCRCSNGRWYQRRAKPITFHNRKVPEHLNGCCRSLVPKFIIVNFLWKTFDLLINRLRSHAFYQSIHHATHSPGSTPKFYNGSHHILLADLPY